MRQRVIGGVVAAAILAASCSGSSDPDRPLADAGEPAQTPTAVEPAPEPDTGSTPAATPAPPPVPGALPAVSVPELPGDDQAIPFDPDVRRGTLDNGLTYYIRRNTAPGGRAELRLAVDAGSVLEDDDQSGVAHFLEHMLFNGTERYPANELIAVLEAFGSEFGPDVNAYTSLDETVYELSVPTDDRGLFVEAFDVLVEWAANATIDPDEVVAERGVVLEEWRVRDQGLGGRVGQLVEDALTPGTPYEGRLPIGTEEAIEAMTADVLDRFYRDWYRPDLMGVVVVGDVDPDDVEALIRERFGPLTGPESPRPVPAIVIDDAAEFSYAVLADPEMANAFVQLFFEGPRRPLQTIGDYRRASAAALAEQMLATRFDDDVSRGVAPYLAAYPSSLDLARDLAAPGLVAEGQPDALTESLESLLVELERVRRDGFGADEFERAIEAQRALVDQNYAGRDTTQDVEYAAEYVDHHVGAVPSLSWDDWYELEHRLLDEMTPEYVTAAYLDSLAGRAPQVLVVGPEDDADQLPSAEDMRRILDQVAQSDIEPRVDDARDIDALMEAPEPASIVAEETIAALDARLFRFANGVTVLVKTTGIAENEFSVGGVNPGGTSVLADDALAAAFVAPEVIATSGVGDLDQVELDRLLADAVAFAEISYDETNELIDAGGSTEDAELVFQLLNRYLTASRAQDSALSTVVAGYEPFAAEPASFPFLATTVTLVEARYGVGDRFRLVPSPGALAAVTADDVIEVHRRLVGDATGSVFAIVGDIELEAARDLAARYLGTLPGGGEPDTFVDHHPPPPGRIERRVEVGQDPQAEVTVLVTAEVETTQEDEIELAVLENLLGTRLRDRIREALGATYAPFVVVASDDAPDPLVETLIQVSGDPERIDEVATEIDQVLTDLRAGTLTDAEVATAREQVRRDFELVSNPFWIERLLAAAADPGVAPLSVADRISVVASVTRADIDALIGDVLPAAQQIVITQVPE